MGIARDIDVNQLFRAGTATSRQNLRFAKKCCWEIVSKAAFWSRRKPGQDNNGREVWGDWLPPGRLMMMGVISG